MADQKSAFFQFENRFQLTIHELAFKYATGGPLFHFFDCYNVGDICHNIRGMSEIKHSMCLYSRHFDLCQKKIAEIGVVGQKDLYLLLVSNLWFRLYL